MIENFGESIEHAASGGMSPETFNIDAVRKVFGNFSGSNINFSPSELPEELTGHLHHVAGTAEALALPAATLLILYGGMKTMMRGFTKKKHS